MFSIQTFPDFSETIREFDKLLDSRNERASRRTKPLLQYDVVQRKDSYLLSVDLPGVKPDDVSIEIENGRLSVEAERKNLELKEEEKLLTTRQSAGSWSQTFTLSDDIELEHIEASFDHGVLNFVLPRKAETLPKKISLKLDKSGHVSKQSASETDTKKLSDPSVKH